MAFSRRRRYDPERVRLAQLEGARRRLQDLRHHRPDLTDDARQQLIAETLERIAELEAENGTGPPPTER